MDKHFKVLDVFRVWAAVEIILFHAQPNGIYHANAYIFADFFFILSGFILHLTQFENRAFDLTGFIKKRFFRLYPLHLFVMLGFAVHFVLINRALPKYSDGTIYALFVSLLLGQGLGFRKVSDGDWNYPSWAISAEFWGNIIFALYLRNKNKLTYLLIAIFGYLCIFSFDGQLDTFNHNYFKFLNSGLLRALAGLSLGAFVASLKKEEASGDTLSWTLAEIGSVSIVILFLGGPSAVLLKFLDFVLIPVFAFMIFVFSFQKGYLSRVLMLSHLHLLAPYTFAVYLVHWLAVKFTHEVLSPPEHLHLPVYLLVVVIFAVLGKKLVEEPFRKLKPDTVTLGHWIKAAGVLCLGMASILLYRKIFFIS
jgi:peptidoglycan/LPS O-acetylase OafA/YrhL